MEQIIYEIDRAITVEAFADILRRSTLADRRPVEEPACLAGMVANADLLLTAWDRDKLVGIARAVTDFHYVCFLSDLAVDIQYQKRGIGRRLIDRLQSRLGPHCKIVLLAAPAASYYYPHIGFKQDRPAWVLARNRRVDL